FSVFFFFQAEDGIRDFHVTGVQTCALPICRDHSPFVIDTQTARITAPCATDVKNSQLKCQARHARGASTISAATNAIAPTRINAGMAMRSPGESDSMRRAGMS